MKKVLILVISSQLEPYGKMMEASLNTWDSIEVEGVETIFFCGKPLKENTDKIMYFDVEETLHTMGEKTLLMYKWALENKDFDYIARVNSSTYVNKSKLIEYIQGLPDKECFAGLEVTGERPFVWGPQYVISRDLIEYIVVNKSEWDHSVMDDNATSKMLKHIKVTAGKMASVERNSDGSYWLMCYGSEGCDYGNLKNLDQHFIRVKQDYDRNEDLKLMNDIHRKLHD